MRYFFHEDRRIEVTITDEELSFKLHNHASHYVIAHVLRGMVAVDYIDERVDYTEGDTYLLFPMQPHQTVIAANTILLSVSLERTLTDDKDAGELREKVSDLLMRIPVSEDCANALLPSVEVLYDCLTGMRSSAEGEISVIAERMIRDPEDEYNLSTIAEDSHVSKFHFTRKFKQSVGISLHQFLIQNRIRKAQKMIAEGSPIADVAQNTGFYDQSHFDKYFRSIVGVSPREYQESLR